MQEIFNRIQETKKQQKQIKSMYRDALVNSAQYKEAESKYKALRIEKKKIEEAIKSDFRGELEKLDAMKTDLESDKILLSDLALNELAKGKMIEIVDESANKYEPVFSVKFRKIGGGQAPIPEKLQF